MDPIIRLLPYLKHAYILNLGIVCEEMVIFSKSEEVFSLWNKQQILRFNKMGEKFKGHELWRMKENNIQRQFKTMVKRRVL